MIYFHGEYIFYGEYSERSEISANKTRENIGDSCYIKSNDIIHDYSHDVDKFKCLILLKRLVCIFFID